jgi:hypothetical protein
LEAGQELSVMTQLTRSITAHAPIGAYRRKFNVPGPDKCMCNYMQLPPETVDRIRFACPWYARRGMDMLPSHADFLRSNSHTFTFESRIVWDPR